MDFPLITEAKKVVDNYLKELGVKPITTTPKDSLSIYFNIKHKLVPVKKWEILKADHIIEKAKILFVYDILIEIETLLKNGKDVNPFLSKKVLNPKYYDDMLNHWDMKHLHLNNKKKNPSSYFNDRADFLLITHFDENKVYFIDIVPHKNKTFYADKDLIRLVKRNWIDLDKKFRINGIKSTFPNLNKEDAITLRKKGWLFFTEVDNQVYMPGLGAATSGYSMKAASENDKFCRDLYELHTYIIENKAEILKTINSEKNLSLHDLDFTLELVNDLFYLVEKNSNCYCFFE